MKLIQEANATLYEQRYLLEGLTTVAESLSQEVKVVCEHIDHVFLNLVNNLKAGNKIDPKLSYGRLESLAGFLAGIEALAKSGSMSTAAKRYLTDVVVRDGQISNVDAVAKIGQIGSERNGGRKRELLAMLTSHNDGDEAAVQYLLALLNRLRSTVNGALTSQKPGRVEAGNLAATS